MARINHRNQLQSKAREAAEPARAAQEHNNLPGEPPEPTSIDITQEALQRPNVVPSLGNGDASSYYREVVARARAQVRRSVVDRVAEELSLEDYEGLQEFRLPSAAFRSESLVADRAVATRLGSGLLVEFVERHERGDWGLADSDLIERNLTAVAQLKGTVTSKFLVETEHTLVILQTVLPIGRTTLTALPQRP